VQAVGEIVSAGSNFVQALQQSETSAVQADYAKRLSGLNESDVNYAAQKEKLQHDQAVAELDIQKKYADAQFGIQVAQIGVAAATGIMNAWASAMTLPPPFDVIAGVAMTALIVGTSIAQVAAANSERNKIKSMSIESSGSSGSAPTSTGARVVNQAADGRYDVIGADDGRVYRNVPYNGVARTGIVTRPTLMGERGDELVVDNPTLRNLRMNEPWVIDTIRKYRVQQRAAGNYSSVGNSPAGGNSVQIQDNSAVMMAVIDKNTQLLQYLIDNGIDAFVILNQLEKQQALRDKSLKKGSLK
jgi:hypothetical protein